MKWIVLGFDQDIRETFVSASTLLVTEAFFVIGRPGTAGPSPVKKGSHMKRLWAHRLGREIFVILGVKSVLLFGLWWAFFSAPSALPPSIEQLRSAVLGPSPYANDKEPTHKE